MQSLHAVPCFANIEARCPDVCMQTINLKKKFCQHYNSILYTFRAKLPICSVEGETAIADTHTAMHVGFPSGKCLLYRALVLLRCDWDASLLHHKQETPEDENLQSALTSYGP